MTILIGLVILAAAIVYTGKGLIAMLDFSRITAALETVGTGLEAVAIAIRNPAVDNNSQTNIDAIAGRLEGIAGALTGLADEENAEDNADAIVEGGELDAELPVEDGEPTEPSN